MKDKVRLFLDVKKALRGRPKRITVKSEGKQTHHIWFMRRMLNRKGYYLTSAVTHLHGKTTIVTETWDLQDNIELTYGGIVV